MTNSAGIFITFEGGEGAGKTTLIKSMCDELENRGHQVVMTREPGGTPQGEDIRSLVVQGAADRWDAEAETALFLTARRMHVQNLIKPALAEGKIVLCDRFSDSTMVYQGIAKKLGLDYVQQLQKLIVGDMEPNLTLLLDIDPQIGLTRSKSRAGNHETRFETHTLAFHQAIREGFLSLAKTHAERMVVLDASGASEDVFSSGFPHILRMIGER